MVDYKTLHGLGPVTYAPKQDVGSDRQQAESILRAIPGVHGVGEGQDVDGAPAWLAYVEHEGIADHLPKRVGERAVVAMNTGPIRILPAE